MAQQIERIPAFGDGESRLRTRDETAGATRIDASRAHPAAELGRIRTPKDPA